MEESARTRTKTTVGGAIVKLPQGRYRKIAQENWGLTKQQMEGMHVHHRIPVSEGGTNDPTNLYVCSPSCHAMWHSGNLHIDLLEKARQGGHTQGKINVENGHLQSVSSLGGKRCHELKVGGGDPEIAAKGGRNVHKKYPGHASRIGKLGGKKGGQACFISVTLLHVETGETHYFEKCEDACKALNLNQSCLSLVLNGHRKHHKGYTVLHFERRNLGKQTEA